MPPLPTDRDDDSTADRTVDVPTRLRGHLEAALDDAELPRTRRHLREALQLLAGDDAIDGAAADEGRGAADVDATPGAGAAEVPTDREAVRVAFAEAPHTMPSGGWTCDLVRRSYPPVAVPDDGPVPDPEATLDVAPAVTVPPWILATATYQVVRCDERDRLRVLDFLNERVNPRVTYRTPGGADAVDAVLEATARIDDPASAFGEPGEPTEGESP